MFSWSISSGLQTPIPQLSASASMMGRRSSRWVSLGQDDRSGHYGPSQATPPRLIAAALHEPQWGEVRAQCLALLSFSSHSP